MDYEGYFFISLLSASLFILGSCEEDNVEINQLNGIWIEQKTQADTLSFTKGENFFLLQRGKEIRDGHLSPKYGAGIYEYKLEKDSISLYNTISSCLCYNNYYFRIENETLTIGDFYNKSATEILVFVKQR